MKRNLLFCLIMFAVIVSGCSNKPKISEIFKTQLMKFLEEGAKTNAEASQGVSYLELREQVANTAAAYDLLSATWSTNFSVDCRKDFDKALQAWGLTLDLWNKKVNQKDEPTEPNINGYARYLAFGEKLLVIETHKWDYLVESYRGKKYIPFDENIRVLLTIAGVSFDSGRDKILRELQ